MAGVRSSWWRRRRWWWICLGDFCVSEIARAGCQSQSAPGHNNNWWLISDHWSKKFRAIWLVIITRVLNYYHIGGLMHLYRYTTKICTIQNLRSTLHGLTTKCGAGHFWPAGCFQMRRPAYRTNSTSQRSLSYLLSYRLVKRSQSSSTSRSLPTSTCRYIHKNSVQRNRDRRPWRTDTPPKVPSRSSGWRIGSVCREVSVE